MMQDSSETTVNNSVLETVISSFLKLQAEYRKKWPLTLILTDRRGRDMLRSSPICPEIPDMPECESFRANAIEEALRWGEPSVMLCPRGYITWAVPVMWNAITIGGMVVGNIKPPPEDGSPGAISVSQIGSAASELLSMAKEANLTNGAFLELRRTSALRESQRAEAIHDLKGEDRYRSIRDIYFVEEPTLISAIKRDDPATAHEILNRILVVIFSHGRERPALLKSFILELVVTMSRSAVEAGADPSELLGVNYSSFADLAGIEAEEELSHWASSMLERIMKAIGANHRYPNSILLDEALKYMRENLHADLSRDDVAKVACLSPSHFSRVMKQQVGQSFTELLSRMRVDRARDLLSCTEKSLVQVCLDCGFNDQSYFTKVFQKYTGHTPGEYRNLRRASAR